MDYLLLWPLLGGLLALLVVVLLTLDLLKKSRGNATMVEISNAVQVGAKAFLKREYTYIAGFVVVIAVALAVLGEMNPDVPTMNRWTGVSFAIGAVCSAIAGYIGMSIATRANSRTAEAARQGGVKGALGVAISGGAVMGLSVVGISLLGLCLVYQLFEGEPAIVNGYAMGASLVALFARSGGGIYTKGADMGADLVGKVEAGIPEDDPIAVTLNFTAPEMMQGMVMLPMLIAAAGVVASIIGIFFIRLFAKNDPQKALMNGTYVAALLTIIATWFIVDAAGSEFTADDGDTVYSKIGIFWSTVVGVLAGAAVGFISEYYTSSKYRPTRVISENSQSGPALTVVEGLSVGMKSCGIPTVVLAVAILIAYHFAGFYGIALAAFGMLATTGIIVSVDSYGPIADNAGGIAEMAHLDRSVREITDNLDSVGNTTAAIGKGFAIGSAAFAALGLLVAYTASAGISAADVSLTEPAVLAGLLLGGMFPYFFSSMLFRAVSISAFAMIGEVRRQLREIPGIMEGKAKPDYAQCVDIATRGAINGMLLPGGIAILLPVLVGFLLGKEMLTGVLIGSLVSGLMIGIQMANSGGAMDNAKKYIEEGNFGGKGSDAHKAAVVGDTVGDPLKDTVGPSINILIKLMCVISLVIAPLLT
ncbi:MAG: putative K(+)-stimulated pyrophosphate-energized sodium pump [candidate division BRC1 bacterium ADurb.BinA292]|nr:MAG: putative K(+)-stimulated pyrophosphate-energized sodium pump [candidate division BRC1 bacterium ADurb.BinA292]